MSIEKIACVYALLQNQTLGTGYKNMKRKDLPEKLKEEEYDPNIGKNNNSKYYEFIPDGIFPNWKWDKCRGKNEIRTKEAIKFGYEFKEIYDKLKKQKTGGIAE